MTAPAGSTPSGLTAAELALLLLLAGESPASSSTVTAAPPAIVDAQIVKVGKGKKSHVTGIRLTFSEAMDPMRAQSLINYLPFTGKVASRQAALQGSAPRVRLRSV